MASSILHNRQFLTDLFSGPFRGHGIIMDPAWAPRPWPDDVAISARPVCDWVPWLEARYADMLAHHQAIGDDAVPYARLATGTELFAAAFGCPVHVYEDDMPCALPLVTTAAEADALPAPTVEARPLARVLEAALLLQERLGPDVPIGVPDIQSPFDIAALIWRKEDFFIALYEDPDAVKRLVDKCARLLTDFLQTFLRLVPQASLAHCPNVWAPPGLGCWLSEDEAGSLTVASFEEFCLPSLVQLSQTFGGLFMHCCATADHQYPSFRKIPRLRGLNRYFQAPGPRPAIDAFAGETVLMIAWTAYDDVCAMLDMAHPDSRFLFCLPNQPLEEAKSTFACLRERCPRIDVPVATG